jgi:hypothetical protein
MPGFSQTRNVGLVFPECLRSRESIITSHRRVVRIVDEALAALGIQFQDGFAVISR